MGHGIRTSNAKNNLKPLPNLLKSTTRYQKANAVFYWRISHKFLWGIISSHLNALLRHSPPPVSLMTIMSWEKQSQLSVPIDQSIPARHLALPCFQSATISALIETVDWVKGGPLWQLCFLFYVTRIMKQSFEFSKLYSNYSGKESQHLYMKKNRSTDELPFSCEWHLSTEFSTRGYRFTITSGEVPPASIATVSWWGNIVKILAKWIWLYPT